jgi:tetratricopeptide (TPR) repeat protein
MSVKAVLTGLVAAASLAVIGSASAAVMVLGSGPERACYEAAKANRASGSALASCDQALDSDQLTPRDRAATYTNRSVLLLGRNSATAALSDTKRALRIEPSMTAASVNQAAALILLHRHQEARETIDQALPLASGVELQRALFNRALANEALGDIKAAYRDLKRAVELDPQFEEAKTELARYQVRSK